MPIAEITLLDTEIWKQMGFLSKQYQARLFQGISTRLSWNNPNIV